jgi:8-oxo-dGTP diphosphatase
MAVDKDLKEFIIEGKKTFLPSLSVDCVIFSFHASQLKVLLLKLKHLEKWSLPGGFIRNNEHTNHAATRVLKERTGLDKVFLQQFHVFGEPDRSDKSIHRNNMIREAIKFNSDTHWLLQRFVTIGYYALVEFAHVSPLPDVMSEDCKWWDIEHLPELMMDHRQILEKALDALRLHINYHPVGYNLLPRNFTMPQLQKLYESILGKKLDRRNFQRKILGYQILKRRKEKKLGVAYKSPYLYCFDLRKYHKALNEGLKGGW